MGEIREALETAHREILETAKTVADDGYFTSVDIAESDGQMYMKGRVEQLLQEADEYGEPVTPDGRTMLTYRGGEGPRWTFDETAPSYREQLADISRTFDVKLHEDNLNYGLQDVYHDVLASLDDEPVSRGGLAYRISQHPQFEPIRPNVAERIRRAHDEIDTITAAVPAVDTYREGNQSYVTLQRD